MTTKELIRAEIERMSKEAYASITPGEPKYRTHYKLGKRIACKELLSFLDTLEEESVEGIDEAAGKYATFKDAYGQSVTDEQLYIAFKAGAEYQYQKDRAEFAKLKAKEWSDGYEDGANWQKEQMMKDAIDIKVTESYNPACDPDERLHGISFIYDCKNDNQYLVAGDRAKIIIVKEEE